MSVRETAEAILAATVGDDELFTSHSVTAVQQQNGICGHRPILEFEMDDLKALARAYLDEHPRREEE